MSQYLYFFHKSGGWTSIDTSYFAVNSKIQAFNPKHPKTIGRDPNFLTGKTMEHMDVSKPGVYPQSDGV